MKYFDGRLTDGKKSVRVVCFDPALRSMLQNACEKSAAVSVVNCGVKLASGSKDEVEILTTNRSKVESSPRKFSVPTEMREVERKGVQLSELDSVIYNLASDDDFQVTMNILKFYRTLLYLCQLVTHGARVTSIHVILERWRSDSYGIPYLYSRVTFSLTGCDNLVTSCSQGCCCYTVVASIIHNLVTRLLQFPDKTVTTLKPCQIQLFHISGNLQTRFPTLFQAGYQLGFLYGPPIFAHALQVHLICSLAGAL